MLTITTFGIAVVALVLLPILRLVGVPAALLGVVRFFGFIGLGIMSVMSGLLPIWAGALVAAVPVLTFLVTRLYFYRRGKKALRGDYGEKQKWVAEMVRDNDEEFMDAMGRVPKMDIKEAFVIADSKQELKELVIERAAETDDKPVGE